MYVNKIDKFVNEICENLFTNTLNPKTNKKSIFSEILGEANLVKHQSSINKIFDMFSVVVDKKSILNITNKPENIIFLKDLSNKYLAYYVFLVIGYFYKNKHNVFISNLIEFSNNQSNYNHKIPSFFNSESNGFIIKQKELIDGVVELVNMDPLKLKKVSQDPKYIQAKNFLNGLGKSFVLENFYLNNLGRDRYTQCHNIVKTVIFKELYLKKDKVDVLELLNDVDKEKSEFRYIEVVVSNKLQITISFLEKILPDKFKHTAPILRSFLTQKKFDLMTPEEKILELINHKIIVPIVQDFMLIHKDSERYKVSLTDKKDTKIKYIVGKINSVEY
jgi:hypothetical protein